MRMGGNAKAERYRERADGLRAIAADIPTSNTQRMLLGIALEYERLAGLLETEGSNDRASTILRFKKPDDP